MGISRLILAILMTSFLAGVTWCLDLGPGVNFEQFTCVVGPNLHLGINEISIMPHPQVKFQVIYNSEAHPDKLCHQQYGGGNVLNLAQSGKLNQVLGLVNGLVFRPDVSGKHYQSNGMLFWREKIFNRPEYTSSGTQAFVIWDQEGKVHALRMRLTACASALNSNSREICGVELLNSFPELNREEVSIISQAKSGLELLIGIQKIFPNAEGGIQSNMEISEGGSWSACILGAARWKCESAPRTLLCLRDDGSYSFLTTKSTLVYPLAQALNLSGSCAGGCRLLYNLDGGGSTQMGVRLPGEDFKMVDGRTLPSPVPRGCPTGFRAVEHYFGLVSP